MCSVLRYSPIHPQLQLALDLCTVFTSSEWKYIVFGKKYEIKYCFSTRKRMGYIKPFKVEDAFGGNINWEKGRDHVELRGTFKRH